MAVTACPTGVAHTFMSAEALETMAKQLGHQIRVETQGSVGAQNALTADEIAASGLRVTDLLVLSKLAVSKSDARRLIEGGGVFAGEKKVESVSETLAETDLNGEGVILRKGKKGYCRVPPA